MNKKLFTAVIILLSIAIPCFSQEVLPGGYEGILLGMNPDEVKLKLGESPQFMYRGEPDVSMMPGTADQLIDCDGSLYIDRAFFQFSEGRLFSILLMLDQEYIDHYSVFSKFTEKYGDPDYLDPRKIYWENDDVIVSIERPLNIKYLDRAAFEKMQEESASGESAMEMGRESFLDSF